MLIRLKTILGILFQCCTSTAIKFHTDLNEQHNCTIEIHKGPIVPAMHMSMRAQGYLSEGQQKRYETHTKNKAELDVLYSRYVVTEHIRGSTDMRKNGDKNLDNAGFQGVACQVQNQGGSLR